MSTDPSQTLATLVEKIEQGERDITHERDRELLLELKDRMDLLREEYGAYRKMKVLRHATRMAEHGGCLADALEDREAAEEIVRWIHRTYDNEETNRDYRSILRTVGKRVTEGDDIPESLAWVSTATSNDYDPVPSRSDMLEWETDIQPMLSQCRNPRDEALIALQFDAGLRGGELYELERGDISDADHGLRVHVDGKQGERDVALIPSVPHVRKWLRDHPGDGDDHLWTKLSTPDHISYRRYLDIFKTVADRAGVDKPATPTNFRKSNMKWLVELGMNQGRIEDRQGRARGSKHTARYLARFGAEDVERAYAEAHGLDVAETEDKTVAPVTCPRCERETPRDEDACMWCGQSFSYGASGGTQLTQEMLQAMKKVDGADAEAIMEMERLLDEHPGLATLARQMHDA